MNSRIGILLFGAMTVTLAVAPVSDVHSASTAQRWGDRTRAAARPAAPRRFPVSAARPAPAETFSVSATYSGILGQDLLIEGLLVRPDPALMVYAVGQGLIPRGSSVANQAINVSGIKSGGQYIAQMILVSPRVTTPDDADMSRFIKIAPADARP